MKKMSIASKLYYRVVEQDNELYLAHCGINGEWILTSFINYDYDIDIDNCRTYKDLGSVKIKFYKEV